MNAPDVVVVVLWAAMVLFVSIMLHAVRPVLHIRYWWAVLCRWYYRKALISLYSQGRRASDEAVEVFWLHDAAQQRKRRLKAELRGTK